MRQRRRPGQRLLEISSQRYQGHYLTERLLSTLPIPAEILDRVFGDGADVMTVIGEVANIKLAISDDRTSVRLEGQDSFGREISVGRWRGLSNKAPAPNRKRCDGSRPAWQKTRIAKPLSWAVAHSKNWKFRAPIQTSFVVGRLNHRTSYSQNQWKHAVESAFLCGMLAAELRLDMKIARRAALMHDIGKSLTHAIDGSHAVIGADYARRLGETELVANAIGAHHLDEPFNSPYALIVAASMP